MDEKNIILNQILDLISSDSKMKNNLLNIYSFLALELFQTKYPLSLELVKKRQQKSLSDQESIFVEYLKTYSEIKEDLSFKDSLLNLNEIYLNFISSLVKEEKQKDVEKLASELLN